MGGLFFDFGAIYDVPRRLSIEPDNIEELTELRDYKSQVPEKLIALKKVIEESMRNYEVCDELCYKLPEQDFKLRWDLYSWPKKITDECVELEEKCIRLENKQQIEMEEAQAEFAETSVTRRPNRLHLLMTWVVASSISSRFGPRRGHRRGMAERGEITRQRRGRGDGVFARPCRRDAVDAVAREVYARLAREPVRDNVVPTGSSTTSPRSTLYPSSTT